jgi:hypothetical protein
VADPDKELFASDTDSIQFDTSSFAERERIDPLLGALSYSILMMRDELDKLHGGTDYRNDIYRSVAKAFLNNNHSGTGSQSEKAILDALALCAQAIGVKN